MALDFAELKARVYIEDPIVFLGLKGKTANGQRRGACPRCKPQDDRILVITAEKQSYYCHHEKRGGDVIGLVAHIRNCGMLTAANELAQRFSAGDAQATVPQNQTREPTRAPFDPQKYLSDLDPEAPEIAHLGLDPDTLKLFGGWCSKGVLRGTLALALRRMDGSTLGFVGVPLEGLKFPAVFKKRNSSNYSKSIHRPPLCTIRANGGLFHE